MQNIYRKAKLLTPNLKDMQGYKYMQNEYDERQNKYIETPYKTQNTQKRKHRLLFIRVTLFSVFAILCRPVFCIQFLMGMFVIICAFICKTKTLKSQMTTAIYKAYHLCLNY